MGFIKQTPPVDPPDLPANADAVLAALCDADAAQRSRAARAAQQFPECGLALCAHLGKEGDRAVRAHILTTLIKIQSLAIAECLLAYLRCDDVALRNEVIIALQQMPHHIAPFMHDLLRDPDADLRIFSLNILAGLRDGQARDWILEVIARDPHMNVCATALDALAEIGTPAMIPALQNLATRFNNDYIRFAVDVAIRRIRA